MIHSPNLSLIDQASPVIRLHLGVAILAFGLGAAQLIAPKGTLLHKIRGWIYVVLMATIAISSFFIRTIIPGHFSPIHLLSILTLVTLPFAIWRARVGDIKSHQRAMTGLYIGGLIIAGLFTFYPGRLLWRVFFG